MFLNQKKKLVLKLSKIHLRVQSQAFSKIFLTQQKSFKKIEKIRHYDIQTEAVSAIASWVKKKCQIQYLKGFYQIKCFGGQKKILETQQKLFRRSPKKYVGSKTERMKVKRQTQKSDRKTQYKYQNYRSSLTDRESQQSKQTKSNLAYLLNKIKRVNNQNRAYDFTGKQNNCIQNRSIIRIDENQDISFISHYRLKQLNQNYCKTQQERYSKFPKLTKRQQIIHKIKQLESTLTTMKDDKFSGDSSIQNDSMICPKFSHAFSQHINSQFYKTRKYSKY